ncbi:IS607 family transposase [Bacillus taeanensis]|uniref:IS607 family transposase n=1 Tax=Bacillus taeanensis TaxID=273032 RepID=A0A366XWG5_9BACI|nr:IS607 family transposase [Bacillus taeanensis]
MNYTVYQKRLKFLGVNPRTLQRWDKAGKIEVVRTPTDRRRFPESEIKRLLGEEIKSLNILGRHLVIYARVSSHEQKKKGDLDRKIEAIKQKLDLRIYDNIEIISDVGSGLNDKRKGLSTIMEKAKNKTITDVAIRYKDRLTCFGFHYLKTFFESHGVKLMIVDDKSKESSIQEELVEDLLSVVTSFSGRLYGTKSGKNKVLQEKVKGALDDVANLSDEVKGPAAH